MNLLNNLNIQIKRIQHKNLRGYSTKEIKKNYMPLFNHKNFQIFEESLLETKHDFPNDIIKDCDMIPQGITIVKETLMITAYEHAHKHNSILYLKDLSSGETKYLTLPNKAHSGGITTHNGLIYICGVRGSVDIYDLKETLSAKRNIKPIKTFKSKQIKRASFITSHDDKLFIGTFDTYGAPSKVFVFDLKDENKLLNSFLIPNYVQGITFYNGYMLLSRSYGRHRESELCIYEYNVKENNYCHLDALKFTMPSMMEQITIDNATLISIYEANTKTYANSKIKVNDICYNDLNHFMVLYK